MQDTPTTQRFLLLAAIAAANQEPAEKRRAAYEASRWANSGSVTRTEFHYRKLCREHGVCPIEDPETAAYYLAQPAWRFESGARERTLARLGVA